MKNCHYCVHVRHRPLGKRPIMECAIKDSLVINCPDFEEEPGMYYPIPLKSLDLVELWARKSDVLAIVGKPHMHTAKYKDGKLLDKCGLCGWDLRDDVHSLERRGEG